MPRLFIFILTCSLFPSYSAWSEIHKCKIGGKMVYTDQECPSDTAQTFKLEALNAANLEGNLEGGYYSSLWFKDHGGYKRALRESTTKTAPIFIYGYTDWCGYCKKLERTYFADYQVKKILAKFVKVKINPEHSAKDKKLFNSWGGKGYPSLYVQMDADQAPRKTRRPSSKIPNNQKTKERDKFISTLTAKLEAYNRAHKPIKVPQPSTNRIETSH